MIIPIVVLVAIGGGATMPTLLGKSDPKSAQKVKANPVPKVALVPFEEDVIVNLDVPGHTRYLRAKLILVTEEALEKPLTDLVQQKRAFLKSWLIEHLSSQSLETITGRAAQNRLHREIRDAFNERLFDDGTEWVNEILFEEFVVQ